jgi:hypothetical protein
MNRALSRLYRRRARHTAVLPLLPTCSRQHPCTLPAATYLHSLTHIKTYVRCIFCPSKVRSANVYAECLAWPILRVLLWIAGLVWNRVPGDAIGDVVIGGSEKR